MQQQRARFELEQKVLGAALGVEDAKAGDACRQVVLDAPAKPGLVNVQGDDAPADCVRLDAPSGGLYFRKLRHIRAFGMRAGSASAT